MRKNLVPLLGIAVVVAFISTVVFYGIFAGRVSGGVSGPSADILVAARDLERGHTVAPADVKAAQWAAGQPPKGSFSTPEQVKGMTLLEPLSAGEPLTASRLATASSGAGAALGIPAGKRAVSIHVTDSTGVVAMLRPGAKVDIQLVRVREGVGETELRTILEGIPVLNVTPPEPTPGRPALPVVTVLATPAEADVLALADAAARIRIALRNPLDDSRSTRSTLALPRLLSGASAQQAPARPPTNGATRSPRP